MKKNLIKMLTVGVVMATLLSGCGSTDEGGAIESPVADTAIEAVEDFVEESTTTDEVIVEEVTEPEVTPEPTPEPEEYTMVEKATELLSQDGVYTQTFALNNGGVVTFISTTEFETSMSDEMTEVKCTLVNDENGISYLNGTNYTNELQTGFFKEAAKYFAGKNTDADLTYYNQFVDEFYTNDAIVDEGYLYSVDGSKWHVERYTLDLNYSLVTGNAEDNMTASTGFTITCEETGDVILIFDGVTAGQDIPQPANVTVGSYEEYLTNLTMDGCDYVEDTTEDIPVMKLSVIAGELPAN